MLRVKEKFPFFKNNADENQIIYFDSACQTLRPLSVLDEINQYYKELSSCAGRSSHILAKKTTQKIENSRETISKFLGASSSDEIVFTKNSTEGINLVANGINLKKNETIVSSKKEHNSNLVPWIKYQNKIGVKRILIDFDDEFDIEQFNESLSKNVKMVSVLHTSNVDGTSTPIKKIIRVSHEHDIPVLIDGAQSAPNKKLNLKKLDADFFVCSGHKMLGPSGTGILYGKSNSLENLDEFIVGGDTVSFTNHNSYISQTPPQKFEAGLQNYSGIIGLEKAVLFLKKLGMDNVKTHTNKLNKFVSKKLTHFEKLDLLGPKDHKKRSSIFSFNIKNFDPKDISSYLEKKSNIMIRSGFHCAHSWFNSNKINGSSRASFYIYNDLDECKQFVEDTEELMKFISK